MEEKQSASIYPLFSHACVKWQRLRAADDISSLSEENLPAVVRAHADVFVAVTQIKRFDEITRKGSCCFVV